MASRGPFGVSRARVKTMVRKSRTTLICKRRAATVLGLSGGLRKTKWRGGLGAPLLLYLAAVLFVWLNYATHAKYWLPYQNWLFL